MNLGSDSYDIIVEIGILKSAKEYLLSEGLLKEKENGGNCEFYVSDSVENFESLGSTFLQSNIETKVHKAEAF